MAIHVNANYQQSTFLFKGNEYCMMQFASLSVFSAFSWIYRLIVSLCMKQFWRNLLSPIILLAGKRKQFLLFRQTETMYTYVSTLFNTVVEGCNLSVTVRWALLTSQSCILHHNDKKTARNWFTQLSNAGVPNHFVIWT